jgi:hypothetical protein
MCGPSRNFLKFTDSQSHLFIFPIFEKMLAGLKISARLKNYENLKIEFFFGFLAWPVKIWPEDS